MGNRSRYVVAGSAVAGIAGARLLTRARRRARLHSAGEDLGGAVMPAAREERPAATPDAVSDEAHAPGHRHLGRPERQAGPQAPPERARFLARRRHGLRQPG